MPPATSPARPPAARAVVVVPVPDAGAAMVDARTRYTRAGQLGMPAHITLLDPFDAPGGVSAGALDALRGAAATHAPISTTIRAASRLGDDVLVLEPGDAAPWAALRDALRAAAPQHAGGERPYAYRPHVSVAMRAQNADLDAVESAITPELPLRIEAREAWVMERASTGPWRLREVLPLGGAAVASDD